MFNSYLHGTRQVIKLIKKKGKTDSLLLSTKNDNFIHQNKKFSLKDERFFKIKVIKCLIIYVSSKEGIKKKCSTFDVITVIFLYVKLYLGRYVVNG